MKESFKMCSVNIKSVKKSDTVHPPQGIFKNLNSSHTLVELPVSNKEATKNGNNIPKKSTTFIRAKKKSLPNRRTIPSSYKTDTHARELRSKTPFSKNHSKSNKLEVARCISLTDIRNKEKEESVLPSPPLEGMFSLTPSRSEDFEKSIKSNGRSNCYDYMKEFDLIRNSSLLNQWEKSLWPSLKEALIPASKSSTSKPFKLKRKTYSCGILSINDSDVPSTENNKSGGNENLDEISKCDSDESDVYYLSENSDLYGCDYNSGNEGTSNKNTLETSSSRLIVKKPIRVKYIDENTAQNKELLIYSNEFLKNIRKEKNKSESNNEVFENILEQSMIYDGGKVRVIPDIEEFFRKLKTNNRHLNGTKKTQVYNPNAQETLKKRVIQSQIQSTPCWRENHLNAGMKNKRKDGILAADNFVKNKSQKRNINETDSSEGQLSEARKCFSPRDILNCRNDPKELKDISNKIGDDRSEIGGCSKSRTALKRINVEEVIASNFRHYFQFYAKLGGRLKSGVVISKMNSHFWLKKSGIIFDDQSLTIADDCFNAVARRKLVLNISDYMQYLSTVAKRQRVFFVDVVKRLMNINLQTGIKLPSDLDSNHFTSEPQPTSKSQKSTHEAKFSNNVAEQPRRKA